MGLNLRFIADDKNKFVYKSHSFCFSGKKQHNKQFATAAVFYNPNMPVSLNNITSPIT